MNPRGFLGVVVLKRANNRLLRSLCTARGSDARNCGCNMKIAGRILARICPPTGAFSFIPFNPMSLSSSSKNRGGGRNPAVHRLDSISTKHKRCFFSPSIPSLALGSLGPNQSRTEELTSIGPTRDKAADIGMQSRYKRGSGMTSREDGAHNGPCSTEYELYEISCAG